MNLKRTILRSAAALAIAAAGLGTALAQTWPDQPIRIVVPYPPGGSADSIARQLGIHLSQILKQQVIVDNRPGGNSVIAAQTVATAAPDGYTLLICDPTALSINPSLFRKLPYQVSDFAPVSVVARYPFVLLVNAASPMRSIEGYVAAARANPSKVTYASPGAGTPVQLATEIFADTARIQLTHVPYKGAAAAVNDLMGGQIDSMFTDLASGMPFVASGKVRALASTGARRAPNLPDVPTLAESGYPALQLNAWYGIAAPKNTPPAIVEKLNAAIRAAEKTPAFNQWIVSQNFEPETSTPAEFAEMIRADAQTWGTTVSRLGLRID